MANVAEDAFLGSSSQARHSALRLMVLAPQTLSSAQNEAFPTEEESSTPQPIESPLPQPSPFLSFLEVLTGTKPSPEITTFAGYTSHTPLSLRTKYYAADIGLWCDELPNDNHRITQEKGNTTGTNEVNATLSDWRSQMLSEEAREVRAVIGGFVLLLDIGKVQTGQSSKLTVSQVDTFIPYIETVNAVREAVEDESGRDTAAVVLLQGIRSPMTTEGSDIAITSTRENELLEKLEDMCLSDHGILGWDFVYRETRPNYDTDAGMHPEISSENNISRNTSEVRNMHGEKMGMPRVIEVLEGVDWSADPTVDDEDEEEMAHMLASQDDFLDEQVFNDGNPGNDFTPGSKPKITSSGHFGQNVDPVTKQSHEFQREMLGLRLALERRERGEEEPNSSEDEQGQSFDTLEIPQKGRENGSASHENEEELKVEQLAGLMERVVAIREAGAEMSKAERERFARREISRIMKDMG